jgi:hypothetical protein
MVRRRTAVVAAVVTVPAVLCAPVGPAGGSVSATRAPAADCTVTWNQMDAPDVGSSDNVMSSVTGTSPTNLYATGRYAPNPTGGYSPRILRNAGAGWFDLSVPDLGADASLSHSVSSRPGEAWVSGADESPSGNGSEPVLLHVLDDTVTRVGLPDLPAGAAQLSIDPVVSAAGNSVWLAAYYLPSGSGPNISVLYRKVVGHGWTQIRVPARFVEAVDAVSAQEAYVGGDGLYRWVNGAVTKVALPSNLPYVTAIAATGADDVWAVSFGQQDGVELLHFDGATWRPVDLPAGVTGLLESTEFPPMITVGHDGLTWLVGTYVDVINHTGYPRNWIARYDPAGGTWAGGPAGAYPPTPDGGTGGVSDVLALSGNNVYMAGWGDGQQRAVVARLCHLTAGAATLNPRAVAAQALGDTVFVAAAPKSPVSVSFADPTGFLKTGSIAPGRVAQLAAKAAGTFRLAADPAHLSATLSVPPRAQDDGPGVVVQVADQPAPARFAYRLQVVRPGSATWRTVAVVATAGYVGVRFSPRRWPAGTYLARARVRNTATGTATGWSPVVQFRLPANG